MLCAGKMVIAPAVLKEEKIQRNEWNLGVKHESEGNQWSRDQKPCLAATVGRRSARTHNALAMKAAERDHGPTGFSEGSQAVEFAMKGITRVRCGI